MKCNKCGSKWETDASRSASITVCPFCQEKIVTGKSSDWQSFDNTKELLAYIATEYGNDALFGRKYFSDHTLPSMPQGQKNLVKQAFECGAIKILQNNLYSDQAHKGIAVKQAVRKMIDAYASAKEAAERVVWEFTNAIGWNLPEPVEPQHSPAGQLSTSISKSFATIQLPHETEALMKRGWFFLEDGDFKKADEYFNRVLDMYPEYGLAYLGLLCADFRLTHESQLPKIGDGNIIINHRYFKRAMQFSDNMLKNNLVEYAKTTYRAQLARLLSLIADKKKKVTKLRRWS